MPLYFQPQRQNAPHLSTHTRRAGPSAQNHRLPSTWLSRDARLHFVKNSGNQFSSLCIGKPAVTASTGLPRPFSLLPREAHCEGTSPVRVCPACMRTRRFRHLLGHLHLMLLSRLLNPISVISKRNLSDSYSVASGLLLRLEKACENREAGIRWEKRGLSPRPLVVTEGGRGREQSGRAGQKNALKCCLFPGGLSPVPQTFLYMGALS